MERVERNICIIYFRFLVRTANHPILRLDEDFREFLERDGDLPRSTSTSALSSAGMLRLFSKVGDSLGKMTFKMDESDQVCYFIRMVLLLKICFIISCQ